jgi:tartrate dehydrogenase/decarboxylase/D-malate dehydrogenase
VFSRIAVERVVRYAYKLAQNRRKHLVSATKSNAQQYALTFWDEIVSQVGAEFPDVEMERVLVDALAARFVLRPESLDVVVASNLFGDILTDLAAAVCGSLGVAPSGNINPEREHPSMFEPVHGSAPDIAGKGVADPLGMIWCGAMMLDFLGEHEASDRIESAIKSVTAEGLALPPDLGGNATTRDVTDAVLAHLRAQWR